MVFCRRHFVYVKFFHPLVNNALFLTIPKCCCELIHCLRHGIREILVSIMTKRRWNLVLFTLANAYKYHKAKPGITEGGLIKAPSNKHETFTQLKRSENAIPSMQNFNCFLAEKNTFQNLISEQTCICDPYFLYDSFSCFNNLKACRK